MLKKNLRFRVVVFDKNSEVVDMMSFSDVAKALEFMTNSLSRNDVYSLHIQKEKVDKVR